ncbi:hypothetical protein EDB80DRAFT_110139 [Ilyonectria destructans]|nr:hypothetical protein EDB80DRAFT_110139 [Ilyonectria destructans]
MRVRPTGILPANPRLKQALPFHVFPPSLRLLLRLAPAATCCLFHPTSHRISHWLGVKSSSSHSIFRRSRAIPRVTVLLGYPILSSGAPVKPEIPPDSISPSTQQSGTLVWGSLCVRQAPGPGGDSAHTIQLHPWLPQIFLSSAAPRRQEFRDGMDSARTDRSVSFLAKSMRLASMDHPCMGMGPKRCRLSWTRPRSPRGRVPVITVFA